MPSKQALLIAQTLKKLNLKKLVSLDLMENAQRNFSYEKPPASFLKKYPVEIYNIGESKCVFTKSAGDENPHYHIIYFHGGSYTVPAQRPHWHMIDNILQRVTVYLTFVNYPLAPKHTCKETIDASLSAYNHIAQNYSSNIILMGDSAGGGLAMAIAEYLESTKAKIKPKKLVLLSPWLDITMDNIPSELEQRDLVLDKDTLRQKGKEYAGKMDPRNYLCSPLYGKVKHIPETAVFTGTSDMLYAQAEELGRKMRHSRQPLSFYAYKDMHHVWMGYPVPEAKQAFDDISQFINNTTKSRGTSFYLREI